MSTPFILCDVFADQPFAGNPLAVFLDASDLSDDVMASLAAEFGWSEITFVVSRERDQSPRVRIWTPWSGEIPFAGHPTVGTAAALAAAGYIETGWVTLELGIGPIAVEVELADANQGRATMTQLAPEFGSALEDRSRIAQALTLVEDDLVPELPIQSVSTGFPHLMVPVRSLDALRRAREMPELLPAVLSQVGASLAYLFCTDTPGSAAAARARGIGHGIEDPATGSAAGPLGAYLVRYRLHRPGVLDVEQGIEMGRPSRIEVDVPLESGEIGPVRVSGNVHIWARGELQDSALPSRMLKA